MDIITIYFIVILIMWISLVVLATRLTRMYKRMVDVKYQLQKKQTLLEEMQTSFANHICENDGEFLFADGLNADSLSFRLRGADYTLEPAKWVIDGVSVPFHIFFLKLINDSKHTQ